MDLIFVWVIFMLISVLFVTRGRKNDREKRIEKNEKNRKKDNK